MKKIILLPLSAFLLSACSSGISSNNISLGVGLGTQIGRHVGLGTSINIPLGGLGKHQEHAETTNNKITEHTILTHFDTQGMPTEHPVKGGVQRRLLTKHNQQDYLVQDFYETGEKRSDPMILDKETLFTFRARPENGHYTIYALDGTIIQQQTFQNHRLITP